MQPELTEWTPTVLSSMTTRRELHGDESVPAISLSLSITGPNTILDIFGKKMDLRHGLYMAPDGQEQLDGIDSTPLLRSSAIERVKLKVPKMEGWRLQIDHGIDEGEPIDLHECSVKKWFCEPYQGGSCEVSFMVSTNDVDATYLGLIGMKLGQEISIKLLAPEPKPEAIDGTQAAFDADHPDAGDMFAQEHGGGDPDSDEDEDSEGGATDLEERLDNALARADGPKIEQSQPGTRTARGRKKTAKALQEGAPSRMPFIAVNPQHMQEAQSTTTNWVEAKLADESDL